jgi:hypothetical protein
VSGRSVWQESAGAEKPRETGIQPWGRNKALKREAHERGKLKQASVGRGADTAKRVAKPWRRDFRAARQGRSNAWSQAKRTEGFLGPGMLKGRGCMRGVSRKRQGRPSLCRGATSVGASHWGGAQVQERTCVGFVDRPRVVRNLNTLRPGESQGRKGRKQAMSFLGFRMETLKHARTTGVVDGAR